MADRMLFAQVVPAVHGMKPTSSVLYGFGLKQGVSGSPPVCMVPRVMSILHLVRWAHNLWRCNIHLLLQWNRFSIGPQTSESVGKHWKYKALLPDRIHKNKGLDNHPAMLSASSHYMNPLVIYSVVQTHIKLHNHFHKTFEEGLFGNSEIGWMDSKLFLDWLKMDLMRPWRNNTSSKLSYFWLAEWRYTYQLKHLSYIKLFCTHCTLMLCICSNPWT